MKAPTFFTRAVAFLTVSHGDTRRPKVAFQTAECAILALPTEVLLNIVQYLDSVKALRATCRHLDALLVDLAVHTVVINVCYDNLEASIAQLRALAQGWKLGHLTKKLTIAGLRPALISSPGSPIKPLKRKASFEKHVARATVDLIQLLPAALSTFEKLNSVELKLHHQDVPGAWQVVMDWLPRLPYLHDITFNASEASSATLRQLAFGGLPHIRSASLNLKWPYGTERATGAEKLNRNLSRFVLQSPQLSSLSINMHHSSLNFFALFEKTFLSVLEERTSDPTSIKCLKLEGKLKVHCDSIRPFTGLQSLHLNNWLARVHEHRNELEPDRCSSSLWKVLRKDKLYLEDISTALVPEFVDYLGSYKGLKTLELALEMNLKDLPYTPSEIYKNLGRHCHTLVSLDIKLLAAMDPPNWWYAPEQATALSQLYMLQSLRLPIPSEGQALKASMQSLVTTVLPALPRLRTLTLYSRMSRGHIGWSSIQEILSEFQWDPSKDRRHLGDFDLPEVPPTIVVYNKGTRETYRPRIFHPDRVYRYTQLPLMSTV